MARALENSESEGRGNRFGKFLPNCFSTQSFNILKLKILKSGKKKISLIGSGGELYVTFTMRI